MVAENYFIQIFCHFYLVFILQLYFTGASKGKINVLEKQLREYKPILNLLPYKEWQEWATGLGAIANALLSYIRPKSRQPLGFDVNMMPHLKGFFASVMEDFCHDNFAEVGEMHWEGKVSKNATNYVIN